MVDRRCQSARGSTVLLLLAAATAGAQEPLTRVSVASDGSEADTHSDLDSRRSISADGRHVAFVSAASNLVSGDTNSFRDVFVHDRATGSTVRVSVSSAGVAANSASFECALSADGRVVAFGSFATNLVPGDTSSLTDIFVHDRDPDGNGTFDEGNGVTTRVSVHSNGAEADSNSFRPSVSADGMLVAFDSLATDLVAEDDNFASDVFVHDRATGNTRRVSLDSAGNEADGSSYDASISGDGDLVAFESRATNLVANDVNDLIDVFVRDRVNGTTTLMSYSCAGVVGNRASVDPQISGDGTVVAFTSSAGNLVPGDHNRSHDVFVRDAKVAEPDASWRNYGAGFPGTLGIPDLTASADPELGATITVDVGNSLGASTTGLLLGGLSSASIPTSAGGTLLVVPVLLLPIPLPVGGAALPGKIPRNADYCGLSLFLQALELDSGAQYGLSFTPGLELVIGH